MCATFSVFTYPLAAVDQWGHGWLRAFEFISAGLTSVSSFINHRGTLPIPCVYEGAVLPVFSHLLRDHIS